MVGRNRPINKESQMSQLYASSATKEGIIESIQEFWYRKDIVLKPVENSRMEIYNVYTGEKLTNFTVTKKGKRYRFESNN
jgi:hypothetical protein